MSLDLILAVNPGTTTTRCALFSLGDGALNEIASQTLYHDETRMAEFPSIASQFDYRAELITNFLAEVIVPGDRLVACVGRGGMLTPVPAGIITVNAEMVDFALHRPVYQHASNLGAPLAHRLAKPLGIPAFVVDPVSVDELPSIARISGFEEIPRFSFVHALNIRACGRRLAAELDKPFEKLRAVVAHLGAGFSIATLLKGRLVDSSNRMEVSPFSPERAGGLPTIPLIELCYSGKYEKADLLTKLYGKGGVFGMLGTKDMRKVEAMIAEGDAKAGLVYDAMVYQIAKTIGAMAAVAEFDLNGIVLTGGLSNSRKLTSALSERVGRIAPVHCYPGSNECLALAEGAARALLEKERPMHWPVTVRTEV